MGTDRVLIAGLAGAVVCAVCGCAIPRVTGPGPEAGPVVLGIDDSGAAVGLLVGDRFVVRLPSNPTTGFGWIAAVLPEGVVALEGNVYTLDEAAEGRVGAGGIEVWTFRAEGSGTGEVRLEYRRSWEKGEPAERTVVYSVVVR